MLLEVRADLLNAGLILILINTFYHSFHVIRELLHLSRGDFRVFAMEPHLNVIPEVCVACLYVRNYLIPVVDMHIFKHFSAFPQAVGLSELSTHAIVSTLLCKETVINERTVYCHKKIGQSAIFLRSINTAKISGFPMI